MEKVLSALVRKSVNFKIQNHAEKYALHMRVEKNNFNIVSLR